MSSAIWIQYKDNKKKRNYFADVNGHKFHHISLSYKKFQYLLVSFIDVIFKQQLFTFHLDHTFIEIYIDKIIHLKTFFHDKRKFATWLQLQWFHVLYRITE